MSKLLRQIASAPKWYLLNRQGFNISGHSGSGVNPFRVKGNVRGSLIKIGTESMIQAEFRFDRPGAQILIGRRVFIGRSTLVSAKQIEIEDDVMISWGVTIADHDSHSIYFAERADDVAAWQRGKKDWSNVTIRPVALRQKCWVGMNVTILKGVTIGEGAIVAAGSVVTRDAPDWTIVAGNPARPVRRVTQQRNATDAQ